MGLKRIIILQRNFVFFGKPFHKVQSIILKTGSGAEIVKNIIHGMDNKPRKGRTLSQMVYESYKA